MPKVSVIIATRNRSYFLKETLESVLAQTFRDYEIIVVDDGSTDNTREVVQGYGDKIRYFFKDLHCAAAARNFGVSQASGEYIAPLDDDDLWFPNKLDVQMNILENNPDLGFVSHEASVTDETAKINTHQWKKKADTPESFFGLYEESYIHHSSIVFRKKFFDQVGGYDASLLTTEDYDLWLRLSKVCKFKYFYTPLTLYRMHPQNKHKNHVQKIHDRVRVISKPENTAHLGFWGKKARVSKEYYNYAQHFQNMGQYWLASKYYLGATLTYPFIGRYYRPLVPHGFRLSPLYRILRTYLKSLYCFWKALDVKRRRIDSVLVEKWSIGIYRLVYETKGFKFINIRTIRNPVLTAKSITGQKVDYVADPFLVLENGMYYMFFEVFEKNKGSIGLAVSNDCRKWKYKTMVLEGSFHLSYPFIFKWEGTYYMLPESYQTKSVRLYEAANFPDEWRFVKTLLEGKEFVDSTLVRFGDKFWLFVSDTTDGNLYLYHADWLEGPWKEHAKNPIIRNERNIARPGGSMIYAENKLIRIAQDDLKAYGYAVRAFEITLLSTQEYNEKELAESPLLTPSGQGWNKDGMHHLSVCQIGEKEWIASVDGKSINKRYRFV
jgi:glycosyltransferase involved in cell wall biosynthesis